MKSYEVEVRRTSYITLTVEAENEEQAEELAWQEIDEEGSYGTSKEAHFDLENIREVQS
jgi:hypothetical protein